MKLAAEAFSQFKKFCLVAYERTERIVISEERGYLILS